MKVNYFFLVHFCLQIFKFIYIETPIFTPYLGLFEKKSLQVDFLLDKLF